MKRVIKALFSRVFIVFLAIMLQVAFWAFIYIVLESNKYTSQILNIIMFIVSIGVIFKIINKKQPESFKLPWIIIVLFFPVFGTFLFLLLGRSPISKKQAIIRRNIRREIITKMDNTREPIEKKLLESSKIAYGQSKYIFNTCSLPVCVNTKTEYLGNGSLFHEKMLEIIDKAEKYILMEYFIMSEGEMLTSVLNALYKKKEEGVEIYIIYDDIGTLERFSPKLFKEVASKGIHIVKYNPFIPIVSVVHNNRDHRKITVVDGKYGLMGGINIGDEYINKTHPYGYWKDSALYLEGEAVNSLTCIFMENYNTTVKNESDRLLIKNFMHKNELVVENGFVQPFSDGPAPVDEDYIGYGVYSNLIDMAKDYINITTPYLIINYDFLDSLCRASKRGVDVRIITPYIPDKKVTNILTKSNYEMLIKAGVKIYEFVPGFIHAKNFIVDGEFAVCGTINVDYRSLVHHFECGCYMYHTNAVKQMKEDFDHMIEKETIQIEEKSCHLPFFKRMLKDVVNLFSPLF